MSLFPIIPPLGSWPDLSFLQLTEDGTNATSYSLTGVNFGAAAGNRLIICAVFWRGNAAVRTLDSATIGGITATIHGQASDGVTTPLHAALISALVPTGTSGTVALTFSGGCISVGIATYRAVNVSSQTPTDIVTDTDDPLSFLIDVSVGGFVIAVGLLLSMTAVTTTGVTEDLDQNNTESDARIAVGSSSKMAAETDRSVQFDGGVGNAAGVCASWR